MNAVTAFENRKEALTLQLETARTMDEAITACQMALEQTACELAQNEQDEISRQRQQAVMAIARRAPQLLRAAKAEGELVLRSPALQEKKRTGREKAGWMLQLAGAFVLATLAVHELVDGKTIFALLQLVGSALLFAGGIGRQKMDAQQEFSARGVARADAQMMVRLLGEMCQAADICVSDMMLIEQDAGMARLSGTADDAMLDLLVVLMEAKASGRDDLAMRSLAQAQQYLHMLGIEVAFYDGQRTELFDLLPTLGEARTIRPALIKDGRVLRRGAAACRMEGGMRA